MHILDLAFQGLSFNCKPRCNRGEQNIYIYVHLFLKDRGVSSGIFFVKVAQPVGDQNCQWKCEKHNDEGTWLGVAAVEKAQHGQEEQEPKEDIQVPKYIYHDYVFFY